MLIDIDASQGEGGGQVLRTSLALSMCTGTPVQLSNIRARRPKPGLMRQHLACVQAAVAVSGARASGAELGSQQLLFEPGLPRAGDYRLSVGSAGSCTLVLQTIWPALLQLDAPSRVELSGGTHNPMAPPVDFIERAYAPLLRRLGTDVELVLRRHGFYPAGGGELLATVHPAGPQGLQPVDVLERGALRRGHAESLIAAVPYNVAERELAVVGRAMGWAETQLKPRQLAPQEGPGNVLLATLEYEQLSEVFVSFGEKMLRAEQVAQRLVANVRRYQASGAALGEHLADQWALPLALAVHRSGRAARYTCSELTDHAHTNFRVIERFLPVRFTTGAAGSAQSVVAQPA